ncbi:MAG: addiction module protein [Xanthomonadales bacterium]|nr:addiction module protein [Xanthomonadales bacterium]
MSVPIEVLAQQVLQLPSSDRINLLNQVISSLDSDKARDAKWNAVAAQRDAQADADPSLLVSGQEALARVRAAVA